MRRKNGAATNDEPAQETRARRAAALSRTGTCVRMAAPREAGFAGRRRSRGLAGGRSASLVLLGLGSFAPSWGAAVRPRNNNVYRESRSPPTGGAAHEAVKPPSPASEAGLPANAVSLLSVSAPVRAKPERPRESEAERPPANAVSGLLFHFPPAR